MEYNLKINSRAFQAIKELRKKVEIRATKNNEIVNYDKLKENDVINFIDNSGQNLKCLITKINWYESIEELLTVEGTEHTLSSTNDFNEGLKSINSLPGYTATIKKNEIYTIHIKLISN